MIVKYKIALPFIFIFLSVICSTAHSVGTDAELEKSIESDVYLLLTQGKNMEQFRGKPDKNFEKARQCGIAMRSNQAKQSELRSLAETLPSRGTHQLKKAILELRWCVSCIPDAIKTCSEVDEYLKLHETDKQHR